MRGSTTLARPNHNATLNLVAHEFLRAAFGAVFVWSYHRAMFDAADAPAPDLVYRNYLRTCEMLGIEPVPRERALGLSGEWTEVLTGRREPTTH
jgi:hypothetical protein